MSTFALPLEAPNALLIANANIALAAVATSSKVSFFKRVEDWFEAHFGTKASWVQTSNAVLKIVAPLIGTVVTLTAGEPAAAAVQAIISEVSSDLAAAGVLIDQAAATPTLVGLLTAIMNNLSAMLAAGHIKDENVLTNVTAIVGTVIGEIQAILAVLPAIA